MAINIGLTTNFNLKPNDDGITFDLIKDKKTIAYGISFKRAILYVAHYELNNNDKTYTLKEYLNELKSLIKQLI